VSVVVSGVGVAVVDMLSDYRRPERM
jgi:hypothetical protein